MPVCALKWGLLLLAVALAGCAPKDDPQRRTAEAEAKAAGTDFSAASEKVAAAGNPAAPEHAAAAAQSPTSEPAPAPPPATAASSASLRDRIQALVPAACRIDSARAEGEVVRLVGSADSNATIAETMRALERAAAAAEPAGRERGTDLVVLEQRPDGRYRFEMTVRSAKLSTP